MYSIISKICELKYLCRNRIVFTQKLFQTLSRKLKEERNLFRNILQEKTLENEDIKIELEKMNYVVVELRKKCHQLQNCLEAAQIGKVQNEMAVQVDLEDTSIGGTDYTEDSEDSECLIIEGDPVQDEQSADDKMARENRPKTTTISKMAANMENFEEPRILESSLLIEEEEEREEAIEVIQAI
eukprot:TRINITY_DN3443_c0_g1_i14.p1 TRINITY_DN3443_c0_g1~~TRINITY_DN3443_c0_g1_i14.p1  ORF type:complete len:184 (+),score=52.19 TRINITY_DN3443_c0_g1_i14:383-934(+)